MPLIKPISGHTGLQSAKRYFEKNGRALAHDYINLDVPMETLDEHGLPTYGEYDWARTMDATRKAFGNDTSWHGKRARTYKHYVFSPDPKDAIDLASLRELAIAWAEENFGGYEVAIIYHDDNEHNVPHAHVIVNNTNLETGGRLQDPEPRALKRSAQRLAEERDLSRFIDLPPIHDEQGRTIYPKSQVSRRRAVNRPEKALQERDSYSWVADIRARIDVARGISQNPSAFQSTLRTMGIHVRESASRKGDWVYSLADTPSRQVTGSRLGATYTRSFIAHELAGATEHPLLNDRSNIRNAATSAIEIGDLTELTHLAEAVRTVSQGGFKSLSGLDAAIERMRQDAKHPATLERLKRARAYCEKHEMLPRYPQATRKLTRAEYEARIARYGQGTDLSLGGHGQVQARPLPEHTRQKGQER